MTDLYQSTIVIADADQAARPTWQPASPVLVRLGGTSYNHLQHLKFEATIGWFQVILRHQRWLDNHTQAIVDVLYGLIGTTQGSLKSSLVALKRDMFNRRLPLRSDVASLRQLEHPSLRGQVLRFRRTLQQLQRAWREARLVFEQELQTKRRLLQQSYAQPAFQKAVQVASSTLASSLPRYINADPSQLRSRERKTEVGAYQYLMRMASKTSPFSHFGPLVLGSADASLAQPIVVEQQTPQVRAVSQLRRSVVGAIRNALVRVPAINAYLPLRLNPSSYNDGESLVFSRLRQQLDDPNQVFASWQRRGKRSPLLDRVVALFTQHNQLSCADLIKLLHTQHPELNPAKLSQTINQLIANGLIFYNLDLPSDAHDPLLALAEQLAAIPAAEAVEASSLLQNLAQSAQAYAHATVAQRWQFEQNIRQTVDQLLAFVPESSQTSSQLGQMIVEDVVWDDLALHLGQPLLATLASDLAPVLECGFQRDGRGPAQSWLLDIFTHAFGEGGKTETILGFAPEYNRLSANSNELAMPRIGAIQQRQQRYGQFLHQALDADREARECVLDPQAFWQLAAEFGQHNHYGSTSIQFQVAASSPAALEQGDYLVVLNYTLPGFGRFLTRYLSLLPAPSWQTYVQSAWQPLQASAGQALPAEIVSVLEHNAQVHAPFTSNLIVPPDEPTYRAQTVQHSVADLSIAHDPVADQLRVYRRYADGSDQELLPLYLGFFHMVSLPVLQRVLAQLSPSSYHMEQLRPREQTTVQRKQATSAISHTPRLRIGRLVLQRESWQVPSAALPSAVANDEFLSFFNWYSWAEQAGLPSEVFVRIQRPLSSKHLNMWTNHKPLALDLENYFSIQMLRHVIADDQVSLTIEEMLPSPQQQWFAIDQQPYVIEFQVEFNRGGGE